MHEVTPFAILVETPHYEAIIRKVYTAYRRCYSDEDSSIVKKNQKIALETMETFIRRMLKSEHPHESPLEMASLTWHITCSRACSHQLVRHRIASYSQQSQRYVRMDDLPIIVPPTFTETEQRWTRFAKVMQDLQWDYSNALEAGIPAEDARYLLPNCVATQIVVTMNFRTLLHFFAERCCSRAQWEIRDIAGQMLDICKELYPAIFENAGPKCKRLGHCPEAKPCGKQPWKEQ